MIAGLAAENALSWAWRNWKLIGWGLSVAVLGVLLLIAKGDARNWEKSDAKRAALIEKMKAQAAMQEAAFAQRLAQATATFAEQAAAREPIIIKSRDTVREYAQTPAGRSACLSAERVQLLERDDRALEAANAAGAGTGAVPDSADPPPK